MSKKYYIGSDKGKRAKDTPPKPKPPKMYAVDLACPTCGDRIPSEFPIFDTDFDLACKNNHPVQGMVKILPGIVAKVEYTLPE